jgi:hypothetical protein
MESEEPLPPDHITDRRRVKIGLLGSQPVQGLALFTGIVL